jgi:hypothetical protein
MQWVCSWHTAVGHWCEVKISRVTVSYYETSLNLDGYVFDKFCVVLDLGNFDVCEKLPRRDVVVSTSRETAFFSLSSGLPVPRNTISSEICGVGLTTIHLTKRKEAPSEYWTVESATG